MRGLVSQVAQVGLVGLLLVAAAAARDNVTVVRLSLALEEEHSLTVDVNTEYIVGFVPDAEQSRWPSRLRVRSSGGDTARPLLVTARMRTGASTWQLPYQEDGRLLFELERTLCPDDSGDPGSDSSDCADEAGADEARGALWVHLSSACAAPLLVRLRTEPARDWPLALHAAAEVAVTLTSPRVHYYRFAAGQDSVRLTVRAEDEACATIAVHNYTCPIAQTLAELQGSTLRMTVQRSAATQLSRSRFPRGFFVVAVVHSSDAACSGEQEADEAWLWAAALGGAEGARPAAPREKALTLTVLPALTRAQYAAAVGATLGLLGAFYAAFGALVAAQRWPRWARLVRPRAVLARPPSPSPAACTSPAAGPLSPSAARRLSAATFDSSDNSDTESDEEAAPAGGRPPPATPAVGGAGGDAAGGAGAANVSFVADNGQADRRLEVTQTDGRLDDGAVNGQPDPAQVTSQPDSALPETSEAARPFGLPARLHVAALARRRGRVLRARSDRYLYTLYTVAIFYALPVVQFVVAFQIVLNLSGSLDLCYYNFLCAHPAGALSDFNHVFSNLGYLLLGALFMLQLRRRQARRERRPKDEEYGIPAHYGLLASLGAGMMVVALLSASYHVCPNRLNFQFDTAFMYVLAVLSMVKIYQSRHPDINARAHATFGVLAVLIALVVWGVLGGGPVFWALFTVLHVFTFLLLSLRIYYVGQFRLGKQSWQQATRELSVPWRGSRPLYTARLVLLLIANAVNWVFALFGMLGQSADFASHLLNLLLGNTLLYMVFYLAMKLLHGERPRWYAWLFLGGAAAAWAPALYFFMAGSSSWAATPAQSRHLNHECRVLQFYDSHDLWHILSAIALYLSFNAMLTWDDGLSAVKRTDIAVF